MKQLFQTLYVFFRHQIWQFDTLNVNSYRDQSIAWMKTGLLAVRIFVKKDMWVRDVAALTFASLMALIPMMAMLFVVARGFGYSYLVEDWLSDLFEAQPVVAQTIVDLVHNYILNTESNYILGTGIIVLLYTMISLMQKVEGTFDDIWHTGTRSWMKMLREYPMICVCFALMIIFSSSVNVGTVSLMQNVDRYTHMGETVHSSMLHFVAFVPLCLFFMFCYHVIPNTYVRFRSTIVPSILAGLSMSILQYGYFYLQMFLSSYNVIYGSLAALPLFLLWMQFSWAIAVMGGILCYTNQNLHHFDGDIEYCDLRHDKKMQVCALVMHLVCHRFAQGQRAYTPRELREVSLIPQQIINSAVSDLLKAGLLVEVRGRKGGVHEEQNMLHPIETLPHLTYGTMVQRLDAAGDDLPLSTDTLKRWPELLDLYNKYIEEGKQLELADLAIQE